MCVIIPAAPIIENQKAEKYGITGVTKFEMRLVANTQIMTETSRKCTRILNMRF